MALLSCGKQEAEDFPSREIDFTVPWGIGGGTGFIAQELAAAAEGEAGITLAIQHREGGSGVRGHEFLAKSESDGYFLGAITSEITLMHWQGLSSLTFRDFSPLCLLAADSATVAVRTDAPWVQLEDLFTSLRSGTGSYIASGTARGGIWDIARLGMLREAGISPDSLPWIGSEGSADALRMLLDSKIDVLVAGVPEVVEEARAGRIRVLAIMAHDRSLVLPEVPTLWERELAFAISGWVAVAGPRGMNKERLGALTEKIRVAAQSSEFRSQLRDIGFEERLICGEEFLRFLRAEDERNGKLIAWARKRWQ
jgi:tripartite-type tricarboxylate transporter receptor subunit TctC